MMGSVFSIFAVNENHAASSGGLDDARTFSSPMQRSARHGGKPFFQDINVLVPDQSQDLKKTNSLCFTDN
jgi:hypothetical protein